MNDSVSPHTRWRLKRQDDHGNQYVVATFDSEDAASKTMAQYESSGHKQTYWIEEAPNPYRQPNENAIIGDEVNHAG